MLKIHYIYFIIIGLSTNLISQNRPSDIFYDSIQTGTIEHYNWVNNFNDQNLYSNRLLKNNKTHQLHSLIEIHDDFYNPQFSYRYKSYYFYDKYRDINVGYDFNTGEPDGIVVHHYNDDDLLIMQSYDEWDGDLNNLNDDDPQLLRTYYYNSDNLLIERHDQIREELQNNLLGHVYNYEYNDDGFLEKYTFKTWSVENDSLIPERGNSFEYDGDLLSLSLEYDINIDGSNDTTYSTVYRYQDSELLEQEVYYEKQPATGEWRLIGKRDSEYDEDGIVTRKEQRSLYIDNAPRRVDTLFYNYYPSGSLRDITTTVTDSQTFNVPIPRVTDRLRHHYNDSVAIDQILSPRWRSPLYQQNRMLLKSEEYVGFYPFDGSESDLRRQKKVEYFYSEIIETSTEDIIEDKHYFSISPNPTQDIIEISTTDNYSGELTISLTDINGRRVIEQTTYPNIKIDVSHLPPGVYVYSIISDDKRSAGKLVVE